MTNFLTGLEAQPDYPADDLTDGNAELLSLMLANDSLVLGGHVQAEASIQAFRLLHPTATTSANRVFDDHDRVAVVDHGVACYEALCALVAARAEMDIFVAAKVCALLERATTGSIETYVHEATEQMCNVLPRTARVIHEASTRRYGYFARLAVTGAALAWRMELDVADTPQ